MSVSNKHPPYFKKYFMNVPISNAHSQINVPKVIGWTFIGYSYFRLEKYFVILKKKIY